MNPVSRNPAAGVPNVLLDIQGKGRGVGSIGSEPQGEFKNVLLDSIQEVNSMQQHADNLVERMAAGEDVGTAEVLTAVQKADIAFKLMMQMRNKLVQAYQEVQNIRV